jgi:hypothetical protein
MSMDIQLFTSPEIELVDTPVEHILDIEGVVPGDFTHKSKYSKMW